MEQIERRRAPRIVLNNASLDVYSEEVPDKIEARGKICDISRLGTKFISNKTYKTDSKIDLALLSRNHLPLIYISGRVVRSAKKDNDEFYTAVEFAGNHEQQSKVEIYMIAMKSLDSN